MGQSKKDIPEKLETQGLHDDEQHNKKDTTRRKTNTNNVNNPRTLIRTTGGKDKPNIVSMWKS